MEYLFGLCLHSAPQAVERVQVYIKNPLRILNDEKATVASNEANKALIVKSVGSKVTSPSLPTGYHEKEGA
jgi:hypothetical protein